MRRTTKIAALLSAGILALTACGSDDPETSTDPGTGGESTTSEETEAPQSDIMVGMAYDVGGRGDQSFNDSAAAGLDQAVAEFGVTSQESEAEDGEAENAREERLRTFADAGFNPIIAVGFAYGPSIGVVSAEYPDVNFAIIDDSSVEADNVASLVFAEEQGSFLVGAAAALKSETGQVGFVGGVETPLIQKFQAGYEAGVAAVDPDITVDVTYLTQVPDFSGFGDPAKGKTAAQGMFDNGADIVYHAAGGSGGGVFEAASESGNLAIGVDSDQYNTADPSVQDVILTSMLKNVDVAVYTYLSEVVGGNVPSGVTTYDLAVDGVGYSTSGGQVDDIAADLDAYKQQIIDGEIEVPTAP
ncbi:MAG: BMP family ABC transporter substrate-binding protein [Nocardioides sp.]|uniref:BMP family lipoprotein n=1 Tax=Nocardioides sp. TaxID=35761 RepID=UPI000C951E9D|nr:BMP family ABC transporter substrate-binding protein [Nocardioides sp.]MAS55038.1 BMP family ABC transporter substrate-binding protein [Pimelobacter sp.]MDE0778744.1 BMP family ABC transporter substrate-binding protein [Nocardioides sp.]